MAATIETKAYHSKAHDWQGNTLRTSLLILLLWTLPAAAANVDQLADPRPAHRLLDQADMLTPAQEKAVEAALGRPARETAEMLLVTVSDVGELTPKNAAHRLFNRWGIGPHEDNGILILMVKGERRIEVELGDGMERHIADATVSRLLQEKAVPQFKQGRFAEGFIGVVEGLAEAAQAPAGKAPAKQPGRNPLGGWLVTLAGLLALIPLSLLARQQTQSARRNEMLSLHQRFRRRYGIGMAVVWGGAIALAFVPWGWHPGFVWAIAYSIWYGVWLIVLSERYNNCPPQCACGLQTVLLTEEQEDAYLSQVQQLEEKLQNVDHLVYLCLSCDRTITFPRVKKQGTRCPQCAHYTLECSTRRVRLASHTSEGLNRITEKCMAPACGHNKTREEVVPRLVREASSSSSHGWASSSSSSSSSWDSGSSSSSSTSDSGSSSGGGAGADW